MIEQAIESMVTHLVQCTCNGTINCPKTTNNEELEHDDLALKQPISTECSPENSNQTFMTWNSILQGLVTQCTQFSNYRKDTFSNSNAFALGWRQTQNRKVLAPLALKQNADNIIAGNLDMKRKRTSDLDNNWEPPNKYAKLDLSSDNLKTCKILLKRTSARNLILQYKCVSKVAFVKLFDILKEIPQEKEQEKIFSKNEFMNCFGLETHNSISTELVTEIKTSHPIKLTKTASIPFSSIYGRKLLVRERHSLPQDVALKKIERIDWYLKGNTSISNDYTPLVSYDRKVQYTRRYNFPKKQFHQKHKSLKRDFLEYLCKPLCVRVERIDISSFFEKKNEEVELLIDLTLDEPTVVTAAEELTAILETNSISCNLSDSDSVSVQSVDLENLVALNDNYEKCLDVSEWNCNSFSNMILDDSLSDAEKKQPRKSPRLTSNIE